MNETSRTDMHVHSTASELSKLGIQRSLHLPECVPDTFISEELTVWFKGEPQAVHVLCYGVTPDDHAWLQAHNDDAEACAGYLHDSSITTALAHPFYAMEAPLTARHRRRLAQLLPIWETRNGSRAKELNLPAFVYIETHGGTAIGGSDDHAGIDIARTFTETPPASTPADFLAHIRAGRAAAHGAQGSAAKWTHAAMALAIRSLGRGDGASRPDPAAVLKLVERVMREGDVRHGPVGGDLGPDDALGLLRAWLEAMDLDVDARTLLTKLQDVEAGRLRRSAERAGPARGLGGAGDQRVLPELQGRALAQRGQRRTPSRARHRRRAHRPLGSRRRHLTAASGAASTRAVAR